MVENRPTPETAKLLMEELLFQRVTQTYLWALPLIYTLGMKVGSERAFGAGYNVLPVWKQRLVCMVLYAVGAFLVFTDIRHATHPLAWRPSVAQGG